MSKREDNKPLEVIAGTPDRPLVIGDIEIQCYVLEDETRVLSQGGFLTALGRSRTPKAGTGGMANVDKLPFFLRAEQLKPYVSKGLRKSTNPVIFKLISGQITVGYNALLSYAQKLVTGDSGGAFDLLDSVFEWGSLDDFGDLV